MGIGVSDILICGIYAMKKEGQQFHQYQQNKQSPLI
jgi:hypothetical protein